MGSKQSFDMSITTSRFPSANNYFPEPVYNTFRRYGLMLSFWDRKPEARPDFSSIVKTLSSYLETTSDYLDLTTFVNKEKATTTPEATETEDDPEHSITRIPSSPNNYYVADPDWVLPTTYLCTPIYIIADM